MRPGLNLLDWIAAPTKPQQQVVCPHTQYGQGKFYKVPFLDEDWSMAPERVGISFLQAQAPTQIIQPQAHSFFDARLELNMATDLSKASARDEERGLGPGLAWLLHSALIAICPPPCLSFTLRALVGQTSGAFIPFLFSNACQ